MLSSRRHSTSVLNNYNRNEYRNKQLQQKRINIQPNYRLIHSKSDTFFPEESTFIYNDFAYLSDKRLKLISNVIYKIPFIEKPSDNKIVLTKSKSLDSINIHANNHQEPTNKLQRKNISLHSSLSCYNLNDFINNQHNIYLIKGRVPCYSKILKKIDYCQYFSSGVQKNSSTFDLADFYIRDERVNEREVDFIKKHKKVRYFFRNRKNQKQTKNRRKDSSNELNTAPQKPRFNLYFPKDTVPPPKKTCPTPQSPRFSSAFILNEKYNIRSRVFKENNIRNFYKELAIAEEEDKHFIFDIKENQELLKRKRSRSVESHSPYATIPLKTRKRSKSVQNSALLKGIFNSPSSSPKDLKNRPRFKLYSPKNPPRQVSKKIVNDHQSPKPSPASVLNEKYNIRTRLFKEMNIHEFYQNLAVAEKEEKIQKSLEQVQMSPNSKKIVQKYMQRISQTNSNINVDKNLTKPHKKSKKNQNQIDDQSFKDDKNQKENDNQNIKSQIDEQTLNESDNLSQKENDNQNIKSNQSQKIQKENDNQSIKSNQSQKQSDSQSIKSNKSQKSNQSQKSQKGSDNQSMKSNQSRKSQKGSDSQSMKSNQSRKSDKIINNQDEIDILSIKSSQSDVQKANELKEKDNKFGKDVNEKDNEEMDPPQIKKYARKVPGFISGVTDFFKEYNISIREDSRNTTTYKKKKKS